MTDTIEFYKKGSQLQFLIIDSSFQPNEGDLICIKGETYAVIGRSFSVDHAGTGRQSIRCNVIVEPHGKDENDG